MLTIMTDQDGNVDVPPLGILAMLQYVQQHAPVLKRVLVSVEKIDVSNQEHLDAAFRRAVEAFSQQSPFTVGSYSLPELRDEVVQKIRFCDVDGDTIALENRCCAMDTCPQITFMKILVEELRKKK